MIAPFTDAAGETAWREAVAKVLKGADPDTLVARTADGIALRPLSPAADAPGPSGARSRLAIMGRLDHAEAGAADELGHGADGLVLTCPGALAARGFGFDLAKFDLSGLDAALKDVALDRAPLRLEPTPFAGSDALDAVLDLAEARGCDPQALDLDAGLDPLGDFARAGAVFGLPSLGFVGRAAAKALKSGFKRRMLRADGRLHHEAGATEAQELGAVVATALAYLRTIERADAPLEAARRAISFTLAADVDEVLTIAKFRALRRLWARVEEACGLAPDPIRLHAETSWRMMTRSDPHSNLLRATIACAGAVLGGADSVTVLPFTAPLGLPDAFARRLARNTALVLRDEAGLDQVADPGAGSGSIETTTEALCRAAWDLVQEIEGVGGMAKMLTSGAWARRLVIERGRRRDDLRAGRRVLVGTTAYPPAAGVAATVLKPGPELLAPPPGSLPSLRDDELLEHEEALS